MQIFVPVRLTTTTRYMCMEVKHHALRGIYLLASSLSENVKLHPYMVFRVHTVHRCIQLATGPVFDKANIHVW